MAEEITFISNIFETHGTSLLWLGAIIIAILILKYFQSISKKFSELK